MLTLIDLETLAKSHDLGFLAHFPQASATDLTPPKPTSISIVFKSVKPQAWRTLMSNRTEVGVHVSGTRAVTGSGSTDGRLYVEYAAMLAEVNAQRAEIGLERIYP